MDTVPSWEHTLLTLCPIKLTRVAPPWESLEARQRERRGAQRVRTPNRSEGPGTSLWHRTIIEEQGAGFARARASIWGEIGSTLRSEQVPCPWAGNGWSSLSPGAEGEPR